MQQKVPSKSRLTQYTSVKDLNNVKEQPKKHNKLTHTKSNKKHKLSKNNTQSQSKIRVTSKTGSRNNENFNSINLAADVPFRIKSTIHEPQNLKKDIKKEFRSNRNSTDKLVKSKSAIRLQPQTSRFCPSPITSREYHFEEKSKTQRNVISRTEKQKKITLKHKEEKPLMKKSGSVANIHLKKEHTERNHNNNRVSIKTEMSSKMNSVIREDQRQKKGKKKQKAQGGKNDTKEKKIEKPITLARKVGKTKLEQKIQKSLLYSEVSFQEFIQENPYQSQLLCTEKIFEQNPSQKVKTEGCQINLEAHLKIESTLDEDKAATKIQKVFKGYIARKYIHEALFIQSKTIIIQRWWRKYLLKKKQINTKEPSKENSLITIKDFNQSLKNDKIKSFSGSKDLHKMNMKDLIINILEEPQESQQSATKEKHLQTSLDPCSSPEKSFLSKEVYVEHTIKAQIKSQRVFNSPKFMNSPGTAKTPTHTFAIKDFFGSSNQKQKIKEILSSPRIKSPQPPKVTPASNKKESAQQFEIYPVEGGKIDPFETNFQTIEEFCLLLVNFLRDHPEQMSNFLTKIESFHNFRSNIIFKNWNSYNLVPEQCLKYDDTLPIDYEFIETFAKPTLFSPEIRQQIMRYPEIMIEMNNRRYDVEGQKNAEIHKGYIHFIFDALEEAFYHPYKYWVPEWNGPSELLLFRDNSVLFQSLFSTALGQLFNWGQVLCGPIFDNVDEKDPIILEQRQIQKEAREKVIDKKCEHWDMGLGSKLCIKIEIAEEVLEKIMGELSEQIMMLNL